MLQLTPATSARDFETIERLAREIMPEFYAPTIARDHIDFFLDEFQSVDAVATQVAEDFDYFLLDWDGVSVGYLGLQTGPAGLCLSKLYILKEYRGKKIGRHALEFTEQFARAASFGRIELSVNRHNAEAIAIYQRAGYVLGPLRAHDFPNGHTIEEYRMEKCLA